ncbi:MAG: hypothetical protein K1X88_00075 [Nannocystaceae bacterium]|nr:hypothetical protein [Nannocystaceae bacterium]
MSRPALRPALVAVLALAGCKDEPSAQLDALSRRLDGIEARLAAVEAARIVTPPSSPSATQRVLGSLVEPAVPVPLPRSGEPLVIALDAEGVRIGGLRIDDVALGPTLRGLAGNDTLATVLVEAAPDVPHATVAALLDRMRAEGLSRFAIAVRGGQPAPGYVDTDP